ncbi:Hypothetical protein SMAX5B_014729 [Scophthalmus maximus]|uniref:Immunoglobulin V-set domain-containing protein n=1 Tax=Scophthalmus maximus TaxID=52904 RepID=A0A2U9C4J3_SCOMX|nr:Hypothetical protein SMAX5B_014729 [Scophthalmus maximus]
MCPLQDENTALFNEEIFVYSATEGGEGELSVTITQLTKSDSGTYNCGLGTYLMLYVELRIIVTDGPSASTTTSQSLSSRVTPLLDLPKITDQLQPETTDLALPVGLTLAVMVALLSVAALCFCRNRTSKLKGNLSHLHERHSRQTKRSQ